MNLWDKSQTFPLRIYIAIIVTRFILLQSFDLSIPKFWSSVMTQKDQIIIIIF